MRYALRNQSKITEALGEDVLKRIKTSLDAHFKDLTTLQYKHDKGNEYPHFEIKDAGRASGTIAFFMTKQQFDVVHLAFKEFIN